jgi:predicted ATPase/DNA-binding CsgD family transcriptional regulator
VTRSSRRLGNIPADTSSFVGRRHALAELRGALSTARLVSIVGPGGVGKSRLALRSARDLSRGFADGAWVVELAEVQDPALVVNGVMAAMDLRDQAGGDPLALVLSYLRDKQLLLVTDNCEHLIAASAQFVHAVLSAAPDIRVIATSREPLAVPGEHVIPLAPLDLPGLVATASAAQLRHNEAVALFTERAAAASGAFELTDSNGAAVADLCRRLDGLPLAIELAAVRTRVLTPIQILDRLNDRFRLLAAGSRAALPRHQTLETAIDWSHDLLTLDEQRLLRRLAVFAGRFSLDDVEGICTFDAGNEVYALGLMASLVDRSLVMKHDLNGLAWYRLHETMREYARLKLSQNSEADLLERRCSDYYISACRRLAGGARYRLPEWLEWMDVEIDNVRVVLLRCLVNGDTSGGLDLATSLSWYWITRAATEGARWLDELLRPGGGDPRARSWAWGIRGFLAVRQSDSATAVPALRQAAAGARKVSDLPLLAQSLSLGSIAEHIAGDRAAASRLLTEAQAVTARLDDIPARLALLHARSLDGFFRGDLDAVRSASTEGARLSKQAADLFTLGIWPMNLGLAALVSGQPGQSEPALTEGLQIARRIDDRLLQSTLIGALGCCCASRSPRLAAQLLGASESIRAEAGASVNPTLGPLVTRAAAAIRSALGASRFDAEMSAGQHLTRNAAIGLALGEPRRPDVRPSPGPVPGPLSKRESEIGQLVADGLTNKQIGARLFISERTVENHVRNILNKTGFDSRTQLAGWIASSR